MFLIRNFAPKLSSEEVLFDVWAPLLLMDQREKGFPPSAKEMTERRTDAFDVKDEGFFSVC